MKKVSVITVLVSLMTADAFAAKVSRIDVDGNKRMDAESVRLLSDVAIGDNVVKKIESFDNEEFLMDTTLGFLTIKGEGLEIIKLDTYQGNVSIKGKIDNLMYTEGGKKSKEGGVFSKLFK